MKQTVTDKYGNVIEVIDPKNFQPVNKDLVLPQLEVTQAYFSPRQQQIIPTKIADLFKKDSQNLKNLMNQMRFMEFKATSITRQGILYEPDLGIDFKKESETDAETAKKMLFYMQPGYIMDSHAILPYIPNDNQLKLLFCLDDKNFNYLVNLACVKNDQLVQLTEKQLLSDDSRAMVITINEEFFAPDFPSLFLQVVRLDRKKNTQICIAIQRLSLFTDNSNFSPIDYQFPDKVDPFIMTMKVLQKQYVFDSEFITPFNGFHPCNFKSIKTTSNSQEQFKRLLTATYADKSFDKCFKCCFLNYAEIDKKQNSVKIYKETGIGNLLRCDFQPILISYFDYFETQHAVEKLMGENPEENPGRVCLQRPLWNEDSKALGEQLKGQNVLFNVFASDLQVQTCLQVDVPDNQPIKELRQRKGCYQELGIQKPRQFNRTIANNMFYLRFYGCVGKLKLQLFSDDSLTSPIPCLIPMSYKSVVLNETDLYNVKYQLEVEQYGCLDINEFKIEIPIELIQSNKLNAVVTFLDGEVVQGQGFISLTREQKYNQKYNTNLSPTFINETMHSIKIYKKLVSGYLTNNNNSAEQIGSQQMSIEMDSLFFTSSDLLSQFFNFIQIAVQRCMELKPIISNEKIVDKDKFTAVQQKFSDFKLGDLILITRNIFNQPIQSKTRQEFFENYHLILYQLLDLLTHLANIDEICDELSYSIYFKQASDSKLKSQVFERNQFFISSDEDDGNETPSTPLQKQRRVVGQKFRNQPYRRVVFGTLLLIFLNIEKDAKIVKQNIGQHYKLQMFENKNTNIIILKEKLIKCGWQSFFGEITSSLKINQSLCFGMPIPQDSEAIDAESTLIFENFIRASPLLLEMFIKGLTKSINRNTKFVESAPSFLKILQSMIFRNQVGSQKSQSLGYHSKQQENLLQSLFIFFDTLGRQLNYVIIDEQEFDEKVQLVQLPLQYIQNIQCISRQSAQILINFSDIFDKTTTLQMITTFITSFLNGKRTPVSLRLEKLLETKGFRMERRDEIVLQYQLFIVPFLQQLCSNPLIIFFEQNNSYNQLLDLVLNQVQYAMKLFDTKIIIELSVLVNTLVSQYAQINAKFSEYSLTKLFQILLDNTQAIIQNADDVEKAVWQKVQRNFITCLFYILHQNYTLLSQLIQKQTTVQLLQLCNLITTIFNSQILISQASVIRYDNPDYEMLNVLPSENDVATINIKNYEDLTVFDNSLQQLMKNGFVTSKTLFFSHSQQVSLNEKSCISEYSKQLVSNAYAQMFMVLDIIMERVINFTVNDSQCLFSILDDVSQENFGPIKHRLVQFLIKQFNHLNALPPNQLIGVLVKFIANEEHFTQIDDLFVGCLRRCSQNSQLLNFQVRLQNNIMVQKLSSILTKMTEAEPQIKKATDFIIQQISNVSIDTSMMYHTDVQGNQYREDEIFYEFMFKEFQKTKNLTLLSQLAYALSNANRFSEAANCYLLLFAVQFKSFDQLKNIQKFPLILKEYALYEFPKKDLKELLPYLDNSYANYYQNNYLPLAQVTLGWYIELEKDVQLIDDQKRLLLQQKLKELNQLVQMEGEATNRMLGFYYKLAFHGKEFGALDGQIFVQHEPPSVRTAQLQKKIEDFYRLKLKSPLKIEYKSVVNRDQLDLDNQNVIQLGTFTPFVENSQLEKLTDSNCSLTKLLVKEMVNNVDADYKPPIKLTPFEEHLEARIFYTTSPLFLNPNEKEKAQFVGRILRYCFTLVPGPGFYTRINVKHIFETKWQPIIHNTELIKDQYQIALSKCLLQNNCGISELQMVIQGSVMVQVNAGPFYLAQHFLNFRNGKPNPLLVQTTSGEQQNLKKVLELFIKQSADLIRAGNKKLEKEFVMFQTVLVESFVDLVRKMADYLDLNISNLIAITKI